MFPLSFLTAWHQETWGDAESLKRISRLRFFIPHHRVVRGRLLVLTNVINLDFGVWESDMSTFARDKYPGTLPLGAAIVIEMFPLPAWKGVVDFINGGRVWWAIQPLSPAPAPTPSSTGVGVNSNKRPTADSPCFIYLQHGYCRVKRCRHLHDLADLIAPVTASPGDNSHGSA